MWWSSIPFLLSFTSHTLEWSTYEANSGIPSREKNHAPRSSHVADIWWQVSQVQGQSPNPINEGRWGKSQMHDVLLWASKNAHWRVSPHVCRALHYKKNVPKFLVIVKPGMMKGMGNWQILWAGALMTGDGFRPHFLRNHYPFELHHRYYLVKTARLAKRKAKMQD